MSKTGFVLDVQGCRKEAGTNAIAWNKNGGKNQEWRLEGGRIISLLNGMALDISGASKKQANIILFPRKTGTNDNQCWELVNQ